MSSPDAAERDLAATTGVGGGPAEASHHLLAPSRYLARPHNEHLGPHNGEWIMASRLGTVRRTVAAAAVAGLALAGCGGNSGSATGEGSASGGKTKLIWVMWSGSEAPGQAWEHPRDPGTQKEPHNQLTLPTANF